MKLLFFARIKSIKLTENPTRSPKFGLVSMSIRPSPSYDLTPAEFSSTKAAETVRELNALSPKSSPT